MDERTRKWRLILGASADPENKQSLDSGTAAMDAVLEAVYDSDRKGNLGTSSPNINRWLGDIRKYFPTSVVQIMQKDALERLGLSDMLLQPEYLETVVPDVHLVATLLSLNKVMPAKTRETARMVVRKLVEELEKKLKYPLRKAIDGAIRKSVRNRRPKPRELDWHRTIRANLRHYQTEYKTIIPQQLIGYGRKGQSLKHVILLIDQSGSMASSVVYASVYASIMASMNSLKTDLIAFDTEVVDLSENLNDPVDLLFGTQLGGGTDINKALTFGSQKIFNPKETVFLLISDLFEGGNEQQLLRRAAQLKASGVQFITLLALSDDGSPGYNRDMAAKFAQLEIPAFACTPDQFPDLMASAIDRKNIQEWWGKYSQAR